MAISLDKISQVTRDKEKSASTYSSLNSLLSKDIQLFKKLSVKEKSSYYEELDLLLNAGLDLESSLILLEEQSKEKSKKKELLNQLIEDIINGLSLSEAMKKSEKFSDYEFYSIQIGEESGKLNDVVKNLRIFYSDVIEQKKKITSALSYPIIVMLVAIGAVFFLLNFVVPLFEEVFKRFDGELPGITQFIINWSANMATIVPWTFAILLVLFLAYFVNRKKEVVRIYISKILLSIPVLGNLIRKMFLARMFNALSLLVSSKNPLLHSITMIQRMIHFYPLEQSLKRIEEDILKGKTLYQSLDSDPLFDKQIVTLIKVAEEVGKLEHVLKKISENLSRDVNHRLNTIGSLIEPVLIIFVGGIVALILVAMYLPLFNLSTSIY